MKYTSYLLAISVIVICCACGQQKSETTDNNAVTENLTDFAKFEQYAQWTTNIEYIKADEFDSLFWASIEKKRDTEMLLKVLTANFDSIKPYQDFPYKPADIIKSVYATDFNGDGLLDIIYDGNTGGTRNITQFFLNKGNGYKKVFSGYQSVIKTDFTNNKLTSFTLINAGGCGDPQIITYYYTVKYANNEPTFVLDKTIDYLNQTEKPKEMFASTKDFSITTDSSKLRSDCYVLDNTEHSVYGENGNAIATYKTGSKGKALGSKNDNGVEWIYVLMNVAPNIEGCSFQSFLDQPTEIKGWILKTDTDLK